MHVAHPPEHHHSYKLRLRIKEKYLRGCQTYCIFVDYSIFLCLWFKDVTACMPLS